MYGFVGVVLLDDGVAVSLGLEVAVRKQGRPAVPVTATVLRHITPEDLAALAEGPRGTIVSGEIVKLRDRHHALARCLAGGMSEMDAGIVTGYLPSRISVLKADPSFQELLAFYRSHTDDVYRNLHSKMAGLAEDVVVELRDRFEDNPGDFDNEELRELLKLTADRVGHGPSSKTTNVNVNVDLAARLGEARERVRAMKVVEHEDAT